MSSSTYGVFVFAFSILISLLTVPAHASPSTPDGCNLSEMGAMTFFHCLVTHNDTVEAQGAGVEDLLERVEALEVLTTIQAETIATQAGTIVVLEETVDALSAPDLSDYVTDDELASFDYATQSDVGVCLVEEDLISLPISSFPSDLASTAELDAVWAELDALPADGSTTDAETGAIDLECLEDRLERIESDLETYGFVFDVVCTFGDSDGDGQFDSDDCAPDDSSLQTYLYYADNDGDGFGTGEAVVVCSESSAPPENFADNNTDCFDGNAEAYPRAGPGSIFFNPPSGDGIWSDYLPGYTEHRGDGSFDYDCDGHEAPLLLLVYGSTTYSAPGAVDCECREDEPNPAFWPRGWLDPSVDPDAGCANECNHSGGPPACGETGVWTHSDAGCNTREWTGFGYLTIPSHDCSTDIEYRTQPCV
jgi:hypothetical protein